MLLYMYINPGQGLTTPWGRNFDVNRNILSLRSFVASLKKNFFEVWFYTFFFHYFIHVYSPGAEADSPQGTKFWCQQNCLVTSFLCCKFKKKKCLWSLILNNFFHNLIHAYSPRAGADRPQRTKFWCQQKGLIILPICYKFQKKSLWSLILYSFYHDLIHVYSPWAGGIQPPADKFWCQQKFLVS